MTFKALEIFKKNRTVEFYQFEQAGTFWYYCSADEDVVYLGNTYRQTAIKRSAIVYNGELAQANVRVMLPRDDGLVQTLTGFPVGALTRLTIFAQHRGADDTVTLLRGRYVNFSFHGAECELRFDSNLTARKEQGLRRTASPACPHTLYDTAPLSCGVVKNTYRTTFAPSIVSGATITGAVLSTHPDGYYDGGLAEFVRPDGITDRRAIDTHVANVINLRAPFPGLIAGQTLFVYPGCNHDLDTDCAIKFNNTINHGGMPFVPTENPYDGHPIF